MTNRIEIETLLATVTEEDPIPSWARDPKSEAQFIASLMLHRPEHIIPIYNDGDECVELKGIRLKRSVTD